jgi:signal peptidase I
MEEQPPATEAPPTERRSDRSAVSLLGHARGLGGTLLLAALIFLLLSTSFQNFRVEGSSMYPNVQDGEFLVVNKAAYRRLDVPGWAKWVPLLDRGGDGHVAPFGNPERGDVIVFHLPKQEQRNLIKRVIALPGEAIEIRGGAVLVNGQELQEDYIPRLGQRSIAQQVIPPDHYFVMGDERSSSFDSRDWGPLPRKNIIGRAWFSYWPGHTMGLIRAETPEPGKAR